MDTLTNRYVSELVAYPVLVRFDFAKQRDCFEPMLLIKGSTLLLKYLAVGVRMQLVL